MLYDKNFCKVILKVEIFDEEATDQNFEPECDGDFLPWCHVSFHSVSDEPFNIQEIRLQVLNFLEMAFEKKKTFEIIGDLYSTGTESLIFYYTDKGWDIQRCHTDQYALVGIKEEFMCPHGVTEWLLAKIAQNAKSGKWNKNYQQELVKGEHVLACYKMMTFP